MNKDIEPSPPVKSEFQEADNRYVQYNQQVNVHLNLAQVLPDPEILKNYPEKFQDAFITMAMEEQRARLKWIHQEQENKRAFDCRAQYFTLATYLALFGIGATCVFTNHLVFGGTILSVAFLSAIAAAYWGRFNLDDPGNTLKNEETEEEEKKTD